MKTLLAFLALSVAAISAYLTFRKPAVRAHDWVRIKNGYQQTVRGGRSYFEELFGKRANGPVPVEARVSTAA